MDPSDAEARWSDEEATREGAGAERAGAPERGADAAGPRGSPGTDADADPPATEGVAGEPGAAGADAEPAEPVNIGRVQRRVRMAMGVVTLAVTVLVAVYLVGVSGLAPLWRLLLFVPFYAGAHSIIEARTGVCSYMAQRGERNLEAVFSRSGRPIGDETLVEEIMERSAKATLGAALVAGLLTSVILLIPS